MPCALSPAARARSDVAPGRLQGLDRWPDVDRPRIRALLCDCNSLRMRARRALDHFAVDLLATGVDADDLASASAKLDAALTCLSQRSLGARRDHAGLKLRNGDHLLEQKPACGALDLRKVSEPHVNASLKQAA